MEATAAIAVVTTVASAYYTKKSNKATEKQIKANNRAAQKEAELSRQQAEITLAEEKRKNKNLLKQNLSAYKARLGAQGLSSSYGSNQAVYDSMIHTADMDDRYLEEQADISLEALLNSINQRTNRNLLNLTTLSYQNKANTTNSFLAAGRSLLK